MDDGSDDVVAEHNRGELSPEALQERIEEVWRDKLSTESGRQEVAGALGVAPEALQSLSSAPVEAKEKSGIILTAATIVIAAKWVGVNIALPVAVGLVKDQIKDRLAILWNEVLYPAIRSEKHGAIGDKAS